jgi:hypothetical protein
MFLSMIQIKPKLGTKTTTKKYLRKKFTKKIFEYVQYF